MRIGKIIALLFGVLLAPVALGLVVGGIALLVAFGTLRNADGFLESDRYPLRSDGYALVSDDVTIAPHPGDWWPSNLVASIALSVTSGSGAPVFVGVGPSAEVERYLSGVARDEIQRIGDRPADVTYRSFEGAAPAGAPGAQPFWVRSAEGADIERLAWDIERGSWTIVVMNADASMGVAVEAAGAVRIPGLVPIGAGILVGGLVLAAIVAALLVFALRRREPAGPGSGSSVFGGSAQPPPNRITPSGTAIQAVYPLALEGSLDPVLRWTWLVKWFLAIPHFIILAFLGIAFAFLWIVAFFAILFTGRYPRPIFDFNVGVMRWAWRVIFYATGVLGTDRYPPFTLADVDYPARLDVAYPDQLSRGLVLIKWWLLAIPHYLIVGILTSGVIWWTTDFGYGEGVLEIGGGIITLLVIIAGVVLLFSGRYPQGLFDLLMGLQRWVFRVWAYAALMTDEYPPFRLDLGGSETPLPVGAAGVQPA
ncbi:MAG: DUF4389 domain-containing protein [Bauldia sp.]